MSLVLGPLGIHLLLEGTLAESLGLGLLDLLEPSVHPFCKTMRCVPPPAPACRDGAQSLNGRTYVLNEGALVLEGVTLAQVVELVVEVLVDLAGGTVADEETTENTHAAHPEDLAAERIPSANNCFPTAQGCASSHR